MELKYRSNLPDGVAYLVHCPRCTSTWVVGEGGVGPCVVCKTMDRLIVQRGQIANGVLSVPARKETT